MPAVGSKDPNSVNGPFKELPRSDSFSQEVKKLKGRMKEATLQI
jgi:hypothetical protein